MQRSDVAEFTIDPNGMMISWQGRKQIPHPTLTPEYLTQLLANGYTDEVRALTRRLRGKADLVLTLEQLNDVMRPVMEEMNILQVIAVTDGT